MLFQFDQLSSTQRYCLITQSVIPRPIAWILTQNENHTFNLAPFSYFAALSSDPALMVVSIGNKTNLVSKDTKQNLVRERECVLHIPSAEQAEAVNTSSATLPYGESEIITAGLSLAHFTDTLPRIAEAKVAMHCRLYDIHSLGESSLSACYLEILKFYVDDTLITEENGRFSIDGEKLNPLSRLGGSDYALLGETLTIKRPN